jgi:hypothetical protein
VEHISVVHEFDEVCAAVAGLFLESPFVTNEEEWMIENESTGGYGAFIREPDGAWVDVGVLVAIKREGGASWSALRRLTIDTRGNKYVGVDLLAQGGMGVTLSESSMNLARMISSPEGELCVMLPAPVLDSGRLC